MFVRRLHITVPASSLAKFLQRLAVKLQHNLIRSRNPPHVLCISKIVTVGVLEILLCLRQPLLPEALMVNVLLQLLRVGFAAPVVLTRLAAPTGQ